MTDREIVDLLFATLGVGFLLCPLVMLTAAGAVGLYDATRFGDRPRSVAGALRLSVAAAAWVWAGPMVARGGWWEPDGEMASVGAGALLGLLAFLVLRTMIRGAAFLYERWEEHSQHRGLADLEEWCGADSPTLEEFERREEWLLSRIVCTQGEIRELETGRRGPLNALRRRLLMRRLRRDQRELDWVHEESTWLVP